MAARAGISSNSAEGKVFVKLEDVNKFIKKCLELSGLRTSSAESQAKVLLDADCRGKTSHGLGLLDMILTNISAGTIVDSEPLILRETPGSAWVDGQGCLGAVVGSFAIKTAIEKASSNGIGCVTAKGSHHLGSLGWYSMQACEQGMIGLCFSNTWPSSVVPGSIGRVLGTNPICLAAPGLNGDYLLFDTALTVTAMRKVRLSARSGDGSVPEGWGVDENGQPTVDASSILNNGALMPLGGVSQDTGGHKGFGLLLLVEVLTSVLAGSAFPSDIGEQDTKSGVYLGKDFGQTFIAIDPTHFGEGFSGRLQYLLDYCRHLEPVDESNPVLIPGDRGRVSSKCVAQDGGVWYPKQLIDDMMKRKQKIEAFQQEVNHTTVASFAWEGAMDEAEKCLPVTVGCIWAMMLLKKNGENKSDLARKAGQMLTIALYTKSHSYKFVQTCIGIELWKQRVSHKVFKTLNHMGISQSVDAARHNVDIIGKEHDKELLKWKESQENPKDEHRSKDHQRQESYGFCCDNIQVGTEAKSQRTGHSNTFLLQTMCFALKDRVVEEPTTVQVPAAKLDPYTFLPSPDVFERQRSRAIFLVKHLITKHLTRLQHLKKKIPSRIPHAHTKEMDEKSQCVTLGVVDADPGSTQGMITVMEHLQKYVPVVQDEPTPCLLSGDGLTIERILHAQRARSNGAKWDERLEAFYACPQEFHKELLHMQDSNNKFFVASSVADRGTIAQLKNEFNHRSFKKDAIENFQHVWDLYKFVTESHLISCAMKLCGVTSFEDEPEGFPSEKNVAGQLQWLTNLAQRVVDFCWAPPDRGDVQVAAAAFDEKLKDIPEEALRYCLCNTQEKLDEMVLCCSKTCKHAWFHLSCVGLHKAPDSDQDWYCSQECAESESYIYCFCHKKRPVGEDMVQCHLAEHCKKYEWYHKSCVDISKDDLIPDRWYCCEECALGSEGDDYVLNHTKALMYEGLCHLIRRQAVRDGNGPAMVDDWKADMVVFYQRNHPKYLINGHYFLACVGGFADPKLQVSFVWNRVANPKGKPGGNVGLDLVNEFVNLDYTGMIKSSGGSTTPDQLARCAQLSGPFGRDLDTLFTGAGIVDMGESNRSKRTNLYDQDIQRFTEEYQADALFDYLPGREHSAFGEFGSSCQIQNPKKLGQKLQSLSTKLDMWKNITSSGRKE